MGVGGGWAEGLSLESSYQPRLCLPFAGQPQTNYLPLLGFNFSVDKMVTNSP